MEFILSCPIPLNEYPIITMAHGSGGVLSHNLVEKMFMAAFRNEFLSEGHDGAAFEVPAGRMAYKTEQLMTWFVVVQSLCICQLVLSSRKACQWRTCGR
jgi:hydrogenase maturation factor